MDSVIEKVDIINANLQESLNKLARRESFEDFKIDTKEIAQDGNNYIAILKEVTVKLTKNREDKQLELFVKVNGPDVAVEFLSVSEVYNKELFTGLTLSKLYEDLQEGYIPYEERYKFIKYYEESSTDFIIMENMKKKGFTIQNRLEVISLQYAELCIKQLAKFHALSYVLKKKQPNYYGKAINTIKHPLKLDAVWDVFLDKMARSNLEHLDNIARTKLENSIPDLLKKYKYYLKNPDNIKCLCHGDFKASNILQKVEDDAVTEVIPIDYQLIHSGCPVLDFLYFIFISTDRDFRRKHLEDLKNGYFNTVKKFLTFFSIDVEDLNLIEDNKYPDLTRLSEAKICCKSDRLKYRIRGVVQDFIDWGYL
ncbi:hypothetical protein ACJJTC_004962 [Scirpophaga incertulas]